MNTLDFGHLSERDHERGICMWADGKEWCATPTVVNDYPSSFNVPPNFSYGALYGIHVEDGLPEYDSMWICDKHRIEFLTLNDDSGDEKLYTRTVWQMNSKGQGIDVTRKPRKYDVKFEATVTVTAIGVADAKWKARDAVNARPMSINHITNTTVVKP
jgi:hypothetical protein